MIYIIMVIMICILVILIIGEYLLETFSLFKKIYPSDKKNEYEEDIKNLIYREWHCGDYLIVTNKEEENKNYSDVQLSIIMIYEAITVNSIIVRYVIFKNNVLNQIIYNIEWSDLRYFKVNNHDCILSPYVEIPINSPFFKKIKNWSLIERRNQTEQAELGAYVEAWKTVTKNDDITTMQ